MQIVELGDCSMVIMKDSDDPPWMSVGDIYRKCIKRKGNIHIYQLHAPYDEMTASEAVYTAGRLVLFFKEAIRPTFWLHEKISLDAY
jgi:hypothetical protein